MAEVSPGTSALRQGFAAGVQRHGVLGLSIEGFATAVRAMASRRVARARRGDTPADVEHVIASLALADVYLTVACDTAQVGSWESFLRTYGPRLRALALRHGASSPEADDLVAELPGELAQPVPASGTRTRLGTFDGTGSLDAWLEVIVARRVADRIRTRRRSEQSALDDDLPAHTDGPFDVAVADEQEARLCAAFAAAWQQLDARQALALQLHFFENVGQAAIGAILGVGQPRVSRILAAALARLREKLDCTPGDSIATIDLGRALAALESAAQADVGGGGHAYRTHSPRPSSSNQP